MSNKLILFFFVFLSIFISPAFASCSYSGSGNWNITETDDCSNTSETIWLNGNLNVYGNLTFDNVTQEASYISLLEIRCWEREGSDFKIDFRNLPLSK